MNDAHPSSNTSANNVSPTASGQPGSPDLVVQAEALFETYLNGRLVHALRELEVARQNLSREPASPLRKQHAREAEQAVETLRAQISAQAGRTRQARDRVGIVEAKAEPIQTDSAEQPTAEFRAAQTKLAIQAIRATRGAAANGAPARDLTPLMQAAENTRSEAAAEPRLAKAG